MLALIVFILILSLLVFVHELGHFLVAKHHGVKVEEFGLGIPPKLWGKKVGETEYTLNWLPFGGFVRLLGEDALTEAETKNPRNFMSKKPWQRISILVAGVCMNLLLAFGVYYVIFMANGFKSLNIPLIVDDFKFKFGTTRTVNTVVMSFTDSSAGKEAGIASGEAIIEVDGTPVYSVMDIKNAVADKGDKQITLVLANMRTNDASDLRTVQLTPKKDPETGNGMIGVFMTKVATISYDTLAERLLVGPMHSYNMLDYSGYVLKKLVGLSIEVKSIGPVSESVSGPVGIYSVIGMILEQGGPKAILTIMDFIALMSLSLALMNIMPFPALDGGRVAFVLIEIARGGKRVNLELEAQIHKWGMILLLAFIVLVSLKDIGNLFR